jgi:outer membrane protein TolC
MRLTWILLLAAPALVGQTLGPAPLQLSLKRAVEVAVAPEGSAKIQLADEALKQAQARAAEARAALLPDLESSFNYSTQTVNLAAEGLSTAFQIPIPGFQFPTLVGPFSVADARATAQQSVFDFSAIRRFQASKVGIAASKSDLEASSEQVAAQVARAYLEAVKGDTNVETAQANVTLSQATLTQAENQKAAGTGTGIEITRAKVQLANDQQRLVAARNARRAAHFQLLRGMGMRLDTDLELTDKLQYVPVDAVTLETARVQALKERPDYQAQQQKETNARLSASATTLERLPTLAASANYGSIGPGLNNAIPTYAYGISVRVPVFDGGRRDARRVESDSEYRAEKVRTTDLKEQIELDVRLALDSLTSAAEEVQVAKDGLELSESELTQARRRYEGGVANSLEVTDAQTRLERARDNQTDALYNYNLARVDLAQAMGKVRSMVQ